MHSETCFMRNSKLTTDLFLTNKPLHFKKTLTTETGVSDYHKIITLSNFLHKLHVAKFRFYLAILLKIIFVWIQYFSVLLTNIHLLKRTFFRRNYLPFVNRKFQKDIYYRTRKKQRKKGIKIRRKSYKTCMDKVSKKSIETNKSFWKVIKTFSGNKRTVAGINITSSDGKSMIRNE